jgi:hypothetical protein
LDQKVGALLEQRGIEDIAQVVLLSDDEVNRATKLRSEGVLALRKSAVIPRPQLVRNTSGAADRMALAEKRATAIAQILESWGLLKGLSFDEQETLVREIVEITLPGG